MKVVIIGGVAGGASAAARLRRLDEGAEIIMLERGDYISFANCGLPYYVGGVITDKKDLLVQTPESFRARYDVDVRLRSEAVSIDRSARKVTIRSTPDGGVYEESYDKLILAPGAAPVVPPLPGIDSDRVFTLRTIPDTFRIKEFIDSTKPADAVIVGGGAIGVEMAENLALAGIRVTIVDQSDHVIPSVDADAAAAVQDYLREKGVTLCLKNTLKSISGSAPLVLGLSLGMLETDMVVLCLGVRPESGLAVSCGLATGPRGHIRVDRQMRTSDSDIYAVGDAVLVTDWLTGRERNFALAGLANRQGRIAADHICGLDSYYDGAQGSAIIKIFDMAVASTGLTEETAKQSGLDYDKVHLSSPSHATYYPGATPIAIKILFEKKTGRLLGGQFSGFAGVDKRCDVFATAIRANMTATDLARLELCYSPPYSSAKDPLNMAGFTIGNILTGKVANAHWTDIPSLSRETAGLLDIRTRKEVDEDGRIAGALHIPLDELRERMSELDRAKTYHVFCRSGSRSYIACRLLDANGIAAANISGGWLLYDALRRNGIIETLVWWFRK